MKPDPTERTSITVEEAAIILNVSLQTMDDWLNDGRLLLERVHVDGKVHLLKREVEELSDDLFFES